MNETNITTVARPARSWPKALLLLMLACLLMQGTAVQAHFHLAPTPVAAVVQGYAGSHATGKQIASAPCALCIEAAMAGHYLAPSPVELPSATPFVLGVDPQQLRELHLLSRAHAWLSRAPPQ